MTAGMERLVSFLHFQNFAALIVTAFGAGAVRQFALVTIWALGERARGQRIVRAASAGAALGVPPFWIRHELPSFVVRRSSLVVRSSRCRPRQWLANDVRPTTCLQCCNFSLISFNADQRGSSSGSPQLNRSRLTFFPPCGQSPLQSSRQLALSGRANRTCSLSTSSSSTPSPW